MNSDRTGGMIQTRESIEARERGGEEQKTREPRERRLRKKQVSRRNGDQARTEARKLMSREKE